MKAIKDSDIEITVICHPEDEQIEGNALASGDDEVDAKYCADIHEQLESGNEWAWCRVEVKASIDCPCCEQPITASDFLGCCSYASKADFMAQDGYYTDMVNEATSSLLKRLDGHGIEVLHTV